MLKGKVNQRERFLHAESFTRFTIRATRIRATARTTLRATGFRLRLTSAKPDAAASDRSRASSITKTTELTEGGFSDVQAKVGQHSVIVCACVCLCLGLWLCVHVLGHGRSARCCAMRLLAMTDAPSPHR